MTPISAVDTGEYMKSNLSLLVAAAIITGVTASQATFADDQKTEETKAKNACKSKDSCKGKEAKNSCKGTDKAKVAKDACSGKNGCDGKDEKKAE